MVWPVPAARMLADRDFQGIEDLAARLQEEGARDTDGGWQVQHVVEILSGTQSSDAAGWEHLIGRLEEWNEAQPGSVLAKTTLAQAWIYYGWHARGTDWGTNVTQEGWRVMGERLDTAARLLREAEEIDATSPVPFYVMGGLALGKGWSRPEREELFRKAVALEPDNYRHYCDYANYLLPRWYGDHREINRFAVAVSDDLGETLGAEMYARIMWSVYAMDADIFQDQTASWPKMKNGFRVIMKRWPESRWNLNAFCFFACVNGDRATAQELMPRIGNDFILGVWSTEDYFKKCRRWAGASSDEPEDEPHARRMGA